jgi:dipeptidyl-peptidase 4
VAVKKILGKHFLQKKIHAFVALHTTTLSSTPKLYGYMNKIFLSLVFVFITVTLFAQPLRGTKWAADGNSYYAIESGEIVQYELPSFNKKTIVTKQQLTIKETGKTLAVSNFFFSNNNQKLLIFTNSKKVWRYNTQGDYWVLNLGNNSLTQLGKNKPVSSLRFAKFNADASKVAYVSEHNIYVEDVATNNITALTKDGTDKIINGTFDWAYEEEFGCRDGFRWSDDGKQIAYWQIDASKIKFFLMLNTTDSIYSFNVPVEYPKVGEDPTACKIGVVNVATAKTTWMNVPGDARQHYIPRMEWVNNNQLIIQQLNRKQQESKLFTVNTTTGVANNFYTETDNAWIDIKSRWNNDDPSGWEFINNKKSFIWVSEKDGWRHLYNIGLDGKETLLTKGNYDVISVNAIDDKQGIIYFSASPNNATQQYLYSIPINGNEEAKLISPADKKGTHSYTVNPTGTFATHRFSNHFTTPISEWVALPAHNIIKESRNKATENKNNGVELITITTVDGTTMDAWVMKPKNFDENKKYPVVFYVYTEPGATTVSDSYGNANGFIYNGDMQADGYIHISVDGRGTPSPKGAAWRKSIYKKVGILNVQDQAAAAKEILKWKYIDADRVAVWGWSGGGSTTLNLLFQYPEIYKTGISVAPVANRLTYDNIYEERYMGLPQDNNAADYIKASAIQYAKGLKGNLLVVHGTGDDNVHYQNTEMLVNELVKHGKQFQMMAYPNRTHSINEGAGTSMHLLNLATNYLKQYCPPGGK